MTPAGADFFYLQFLILEHFDTAQVGDKLNKHIVYLIKISLGIFIYFYIEIRGMRWTVCRGITPLMLARRGGWEVLVEQEAQLDKEMEMF